MTPDALDHQLAIADGPTAQLTDKGDRAIRGNTNQVLQRCAALVRRIKLRLQGQLRFSVHNSVASKTINVSGEFAQKHTAMDAFTSSQDCHDGSRPSLKYKKLIHFLKGE